MTSLRILLTAWPRWIAPFAYGGPSCSTNGSRPFAFSRRRAYRPSDSQRSSVTGSRLGRSPRIGNSVAGRCRVALYGLSGFVVLSALTLVAEMDGSCKVRASPRGRETGRASGRGRGGQYGEK